MKNLNSLIVLSLATWRLTHLLVHEDGPSDVLGKFRSQVGVRWDEYSRPYGTNVLSDAFLCVWCFSMWVGFVFALVAGKKNFIVNWLAISAGAIIIDEMIEKGNNEQE